MSATTPERVSVRIDDRVAIVSLNRPDKHNALDFAMAQGLNEAQSQIAADPSIRAVVLRGEGPSFCAGLDFPSLAAENRTAADLLAPFPGSEANYAQRIAHGWSVLPQPVIAVLRKHVLGGGFQIAMGADLRFAAPDLGLSLLEIKWGLIPDMGITQMLPKLVGVDVAMDLMWTGRTLDATEARDLGLVTRVVDDPDDAALEAAHLIATKNPEAVQWGKHLLRQTWNATSAEGLALEEELQRRILTGANHPRAVAAAFDGSTPQFDDPAPL